MLLYDLAESGVFLFFPADDNVCVLESLSKIDIRLLGVLLGGGLYLEAGVCLGDAVFSKVYLPFNWADA